MRALCDPDLGAYAKVLLAYLCERANTDGVCWPGNDKVIEDTGLSRPTYFRCKAELLESGKVADRSDLRAGALEVYPESHTETKTTTSESLPETKQGSAKSPCETNESQAETAKSPCETNESQAETEKSPCETNESQAETEKSHTETAYRCINSSGTDQEPTIEPTRELRASAPPPLHRPDQIWPKTPADNQHAQAALPLLVAEPPQDAVPANPTNKHEALAIQLLSELSAARKRVAAGARDLEPTAGNLQHILARLKDRPPHTADQIRHVIAVGEAKARAEGSIEWFNARTPFRRDNISSYLGMKPEDVSRRMVRAGGPWRPDPTVGRNDKSLDERAAELEEWMKR